MANGTIAASQLEMLTLSGTGIITIVPPNTNTNRTLTLPNSTGTMATAESTLAQFNASGSAPVYACRAWVNFNGTGTVAIRASGNVTSITDNGTGDYTVNFTTAMPDTNYSAVMSCGEDNSANSGLRVANCLSNTLRSTTALRMATTTIASGTNRTWIDDGIISVATFR